MTDHELYESWVSAWVLGSAEPAEVAELEAHLQTCSTCRALAVRLGRVVEALPLAADDVRPPAALRARILSAAAAGRDRAEAVEPARIVPLRPVAPRTRRLGLAVRWPQAAVAAMAIAIIGLGAWDWSLSQQLAAGSSKVYVMHGTGTMAVAQGDVTYYPRDGFALVDFSSMPALASGKVYELWLIPASGAPVPAGVFQVGAAGSTTVVVHKSMEGVKLVAVTVENGPNGTTAPTQQPELAATLS